MRINVPKETNLKVESNLVRRLELEHIVEQIESLTMIPDFGYSADAKQEDHFRGWEMYLELIQNTQKYERVENHMNA
jgi:hypothetical protein